MSEHDHDLQEWIDSAEGPQQLAFRRAVHTILSAIARSEVLQPQTFIKGGVLLGIRYHSVRFTKDLDASVTQSYSEPAQELILSALNTGLAEATADLPYDLECRVQSFKLKPPRPEGNFQTLEIRVAYAYRTSKTYQRLLRKQCPNVVSIDYSFNEEVHDTDMLSVTDEMAVTAYGVHTLIAEKYRAMLQQPIRDRDRPQDAYDIDYLLQRCTFDPSGLQLILHAIHSKAESRDFLPKRADIRSPEIHERSHKRYQEIADQLPDRALPDFEEMFERVAVFYESLPWQE
jgi:hypothetical protein